MLIDLSQARQVYLALCAERLALISRAQHDLDDLGMRQSALERIRQEAHRIRGVAGTFGHQKLGDACERVETFLDGDREVAEADLRPLLGALLSALEDVVNLTVAPDDDAAAQTSI